MSQPIWTEHYEPGVPITLAEDAGLFHDILRAAAAGAPGWPAVTSCNRTVGFAELDALTGRVAASLLRDGVQPGDHVLIALTDSLPFAAAALGAMRVGAVVVTADPESPGAAIAETVRLTKPVVIVAANGAAMDVAGGDAALVVVRTVDQLPLFLRLVYRFGAPGAWRAGMRTPKNARRWHEWLEKSAPDDEIDVAPDHPALAVAGGQDEACTFTHAQLVTGALQMRAWLTDAMPGDDTWLMLAALGSPFGLVAGLGAAVLLRARLVLVPGGDSADALDALRYLRPAYVAAAAGPVDTLVADPSLSRSDFHSVRACLVADPLHPNTARQFEQATGLSPCQGFSVPRAAGLVTCNPINGHRAADSVGLPMPDVEVRLVDDRGEAVASGDEGQLELRGPNIACADGWQSAGVRARLDASGYVFLVDTGSRPSRTAELRGGST